MINAQNHCDRNQIHQNSRTTVTHEWQGQAFGWQGALIHAMLMKD